MTRRHLTISCALVLLTVIAGCSGGLDQVTDSANQLQETTHCSNGQIPSDANLEDLAPSAPDGWDRVTVKVSTTEVVEGDSSQAEEQQLLAGNYTDPEGHSQLLLIAKLSDEEKEESTSSNGSIFGPQAVSGNYFIAVWGNSSGSHSTTLLTSVHCISEDDVTPRQELTLNYSSGDLPNFTSNFTLDSVNLSSHASASYSNVDYELNSDTLGNSLNVTVEGEFENTSLVIKAGNGTAFITEEELADGRAKTEVHFIGDLTQSSPMTLTISPMAPDLNETYTEEITYQEPELEVSNIRVETEEVEFLDGHRVTRLQFDIHNSGGVAAQIGTARVIVNGEDRSMFLMESVEADSTRQVDSDDHPIMAPNLKDGQNTIEVQIVVGGEVVASESTTVSK